jgi:hypothetical protein
MSLGPVYEETRASQVASAAGKAVDVRTTNGAVTLERADRSDVQITAKLVSPSKERLAEAEVVTDRREDGTLLVYVAWPGDRSLSREGCTFDIKLPGATGVKIESSNGAIRVDGLGGAANLETSNGSITVTGFDGPVTAHSSNGKIVVRDIEGRADVRTSNGSIEISGVAGGVHAESSNGGVAVTLRPEAMGPVEAHTSNGSITLEIGPAFAGELSAQTSNGGLHLADLGATVVSMNKHDAVLRFGTGGERSRLTTSNGSVVIREGKRSQ